MTSFNTITPKRPYLQIQSYWALGIRASTCGFGGRSWVHSSIPGTTVSEDSGRCPRATCPLCPSSPGTAPPWQRAEGRHAPRGTQAHRLSSPLSNNLTTRKQCRVRVYAPVILLGTGNAGCGSEQAAVGSPLGDCRPRHGCPTQSIQPSTPTGHR